MDRELVSAAVRGDPGATEKLLRLLRPVVVRYCARRLGGYDHRISGPEDCAQDVLAAVITALPRYRYPAERFLSFVFGVAAHKIADVYRKRERDRSAPVADFDDGSGECVRVAGERDEIELADHRFAVTWLLERLPRQHREVLTMRVLYDYSAEATATALDMPSAGAVRVAQHRALTTLRQLLAADPVL
ncbi:sigma-70 family RNA polymerase sigma factor [Amycolatopsis sp. CA-230715]|uniref:sigma-70 family RNA polymerase sigma factor n=1 Tax=Amycolatopsis sp. CA-230715 TaxID=2745196 RepID=UPI0020B2FA1B|nr:sigma-70 family RNA polymerase sigma factor [Amycolatopsis sp. CA-230715]